MWRLIFTDPLGYIAWRWQLHKATKAMEELDRITRLYWENKHP